MLPQIEATEEQIDSLYKGSLTVEDLSIEHNPNQYLVLVRGNIRVPFRILESGKLESVNRKVKAKDIKPRKSNEEQLVLLDALLNDDIPVVVVTGSAGTGKTLLTIAAALQKVEDCKYDRIIITKPIEQVGENDFGILPGTIQEKFTPFLGNYTSNLEEIYGQPVHDPTIAGMEMVPIQFIRGISWNNKFVIADEIQPLTHHEILTLGTRVGKGTKLVMMGDLNQRDRDIAIGDTGLHHLVNHPIFQKSALTAHINLTKVERSKVTQLFTEVFE